MTDFPDLKFKAQVQFPARVLDGAGIDIVKSNGAYQFNLDFGDFAPPVTSITDPTHQNFLLWNDATGQYALASTLLVSGSGPPGPQGPAGPPGASGSGSGNVTGPGSAIADRIAVYNGTSGTVIKDGGQIVANLAPLASPAFTGTISLQGSAFATKASGYTRIINGDGGVTAFQAGGVSDPTNYFLNTNHQFRDIPGTTVFATLTAAGLIAPIISTSYLNTSDTTAGHNFNHGLFGGNFNLSQSINVLALDKVATDVGAGPRFTAAITSEVAGGHANGPDSTRAGLWLYAGKKNYLTTTQTGEIDGGYVLAQQGNKDDVGGLNIGVYKVFGGTGDTGGAIGLETSVNRVNPAGTVTTEAHAIVGFQEGTGGALNAGGASFYAEAFTGTPRAGLAIVNFTGAFDYAIAAFSSRNPANMYYNVQYDGDVAVTWGLLTDCMRIRYVSSLDVMVWRDETNSANIASLTKGGQFSASTGVRVATGSTLLTKVLKQTASLDFPNTLAQNSSSLNVTVTGATVGDLVCVSPDTTYASGGAFFTGRVVSANTVTVVYHNFSSAAIDPAAQNVIILVVGG